MKLNFFHLLNLFYTFPEVYFMNCSFCIIYKQKKLNEWLFIIIIIIIMIFFFFFFLINVVSL